MFSPDGKHLACRALRDGKELLVCDDREIEVPGAVCWVGFSPDGNHLAAVVRTPAGGVMLCDGLASAPHDKLCVPERWDVLAGKLRYVVIDKGEASLVEADWPEGRTWEDAFRTEEKK